MPGPQAMAQGSRPRSFPPGTAGLWVTVCAQFHGVQLGPTLLKRSACPLQASGVGVGPSAAALLGFLS